MLKRIVILIKYIFANNAACNAIISKTFSKKSSKLLKEHISMKDKLTTIEILAAKFRASRLNLREVRA